MAKIIYDDKKGQRKIKLILHRADADIDVIDIASGETLDNVESIEFSKFAPGAIPFYAKVTLIVDDITMEAPPVIEEEEA